MKKMAILGMKSSYLPKCKTCGRPITFLEWRKKEICRDCLKEPRKEI